MLISVFCPALKNSLCHLYMYNDDMQLVAEISPTGLSVMYKYDGLGRLREKYYIEMGDDESLDVKHIINQYDYYFK